MKSIRFIIHIEHYLSLFFILCSRQSTSNEVTFSQSRIPSRPAARFAKIDVFIQGNVNGISPIFYFKPTLTKL